MISAKLLKSLERTGFQLDFPEFSAIEDQIIEIILEQSERLDLALPLILDQDFDYLTISKNLDDNSQKRFDSIIIISHEIYKNEGINNTHLKKIIKENQIRSNLNDYQRFYEAFLDFKKNKKQIEEESLKYQIRIRSKLNINEAATKIFSPGKRRIMKKIFHHELLTNSELKYYYRSIRPIILSILNENLQNYMRIVESTKKYYK